MPAFVGARKTIGSTPSWVRNVYGQPSLVLHFDEGKYWVQGGDGSLASILSTSRNSVGYAETSGGILVPFAANVPRITDKGLGAWEARTKVALWNRDFTNAAWSKTDVTAAKDQTGVDGVANAASSLTATAGNGTVLQAITLASSARFQTAYVKRLTGSGTINMTMDNGSTWTAISPTTSWSRLSIPTQTLANPTVGFRIVTSGDAIAVDFFDNENGTFATPPTVVTTAAVPVEADVISLTGAAATAALAAKAAFVQTGAGAQVGVAGYLVSWGGGALIYAGSNAKFRANNDTVEASATIGGSGTYSGNRVKGAAGFNSSSMTAVANGGTLVSTDGNFTATQTGTVVIGNRAAGNRALNGYLERIAFSPIKGMFDGMTA